ncbi:hypothetical protein Dimus_001538 [Dionaea muscipula]
MLDNDASCFQVVLDGYSAPLLVGNFAELLNCANQAVLSDNNLDKNIGYSVPLEIMPSGQFKPLYRTTLSVQDGELPVLPLSVYGAIAMAHSEVFEEFSSPNQFFFYLYDKRNVTAVGGDQRVDFGLSTAIDLGAGKEAAAKAQNGGECKCEAAAANVIIISTETSNGRVVKERSRKKKTGGGPTFTSLLTARSKEAAAIGGVARKREDLIIVNIDDAFGDDELAIAEYAEDIYKFYKLTELQLSRGRVRFVIT